MRKKIRLCILFLLIQSVVVFSQDIKGKVVDINTGRPISKASVFISGSSIGSNTGKTGLFNLHPNIDGYVDLVVFHSGYKISAQKIDLEAQKRGTLVIKLTPRDNQSDTPIFPNDSTNRVENNKRFANFLLGNTPFGDKCTILNAYNIALNFNKQQNIFRAWSSAPIEIRNAAIGYKVFLVLDTFVVNYNTNSTFYKGYTFFKELQNEATKTKKGKKQRHHNGSNSLKSMWVENRKIAYLGSSLHFFKSLASNTIAQEGFELARLSNNTPIAIKPEDLQMLTIENGAKQINFSDPLQVTFTKALEDPAFLRLTNPKATPKSQVSIIEFKIRPSIIEANGQLRNPKGIVLDGYMTWKRMGDILPIDYKP